MSAPGAWRDRFHIPDPDLVYLDGNSLGRLPRATLDLAGSLVGEQWGERLIRGWNEGWFELPLRVGDKIGRLIGARPGETAVADSTTVNLHRLATAAVAARPGRRRIVTDDLDFPSDHHALARVAADAGLTLDILASPDGVHGADLAASLDDDVALVSLSATAYRSGFTRDLAADTAAAHAVGALALWDLSHTAGSAPVDLAGAGVDLAVGCSYKYLNGGPGAPAWQFIRTDLQDELTNPLQGWMGAADVFAFASTHTPAPGMRRFLSGTPPVLATALLEPGVDLLLEVGVDRLRAASLALTDRLIERIDAELPAFGIGSPRDQRHRGGHVLLTHSDAMAINLALHERGIIPDVRPPDGLRIGPAPLYTTLDDIDRLVDALAGILAGGEHQRHRGRDVVVP